MKPYLLCLLLVHLCCACSEQQSKEGSQEAISLDSTESKRAFGSYSHKFQKITKSENGIIRGVNFGDALQDVITREDTTVQEEGTNFVGFTIALDNTEAEITDVLYYFDEKERISGFRLDVYLDNEEAVDSLQREFTAYFTEKYGSPVSKETKNTTWIGADNTRILIKDVGIKESPGFQLQIAQPK